jgi:hypothetical protein
VSLLAGEFTDPGVYIHEGSHGQNRYLKKKDFLNRNRKKNKYHVFKGQSRPLKKKQKNATRKPPRPTHRVRKKERKKERKPNKP